MPDSSNDQCIKTALLPVLASFCSQFPIKIDPRKLLQVAPDYMQQVHMTHYKVAWIQAIIEANISRFHDINWTDPDLLIQVDEIQKYFSGVLEETMREYLETEDAREEMLWKKVGIIINDNPVASKVHPEYLISRSITIKLLIHVAPCRLVYSDETLKKIVKKKQKEANEARHPHLKQTSLFSELILNVSKYCTENPVKLDITKLPKRIWLKYLAGYLAIPSSTLLFKDIIYDDDLRNTTARIHVQLRKTLNKKLDIIIEPLSEIFVDQLKIAEDAGVIDIAQVAVNKTSSSFDNLSCEVTRELALDLLRLIPEFNYLFNDVKNSEHKIDDHMGLKVNSGVDEEKKSQLTSNLLEDTFVNLIPKKRKKKTKTQTRLVLEQLAEYLVINGICKTYIEFKRWIILHYIQRNTEKLVDEDKFNDHSIIKNLYCVPATPKENQVLKYKKYIVHYSIENETGTIIPQKSYSLSSFKDIFDTVIALRHMNVNK
jgi:hypothetical protein